MMEEKIKSLEQEQKDIRKKIKKIKNTDYLELKRIYLKFDYREIRFLLKERQKVLTKEISRLNAKEKRKLEVKINWLKEFNYVKKLLFDEYDISKLRLILTSRLRPNKFISFDISGKKFDVLIIPNINLIEVRKQIMEKICQSLYELNNEEHPFEEYHKKIIKDFCENTIKDKSYSKIIEHMAVENL